MNYEVVDNTVWLPANGHDIYNYTSRYGVSDFQFQFVMKLDGKLDPFRLLKAVRLSMEEEPVFGCRFVEDEHTPHWEPLGDIDKTMFCLFEETNNLDEAVQKYLESPLNTDNAPQVKLKLIRSGKYDTLCIKINHASCDGGGAKEYIHLLSDIYTFIDRNDDLIPIPSMRDRRDQERIFETLGIKDPEAAWNPEFETLKPTWVFPWHQGQPETYRVATRRLSQEQLNELSNFGKGRGAKINDLLLTAYYRALFEMLEPQYSEPMEITVTVDLRRYLPNCKTSAIRNLSGSVNTRIARVEAEPFEETLSRVMVMMSEIKNSYPGLQSAIGLERLEKLKFSEALNYRKCLGELTLNSGLCSPVLSNLGYLGKSPFRFGENVVNDAYLITPAVFAPGFLLGVSTYNGVLTLVVSYYEATTAAPA